MDIELRHLRYFVAVAEEAGFTAAARRVHVTQQVLSAQVRQLEDAVGTALLSRTSRGVVLTAAGSAFLDVAREILAVAGPRRGGGAERGPGGVRAAGGGAERGDRRAGAFAGAGRVLRRVPVGRRSTWRSYDLAHPAAGLLDHGTDVALLRPPVDAPGLAVEVVAAEPRVFVLAAGHPLASAFFAGAGRGGRAAVGGGAAVGGRVRAVGVPGRLAGRAAAGRRRAGGGRGGADDRGVAGVHRGRARHRPVPGLGGGVQRPAGHRVRACPGRAADLAVRGLAGGRPAARGAGLRQGSGERCRGLALARWRGWRCRRLALLARLARRRGAAGAAAREA